MLLETALLTEKLMHARQVLSKSTTMASIHPSDLVVGKSYELVKTVGGTQTRTNCGRFVSCRLIGRPYDPDAVLTFILPTGLEFSFMWDMQSKFFEIVQAG